VSKNPVVGDARLNGYLCSVKFFDKPRFFELPEKAVVKEIFGIGLGCPRMVGNRKGRAALIPWCLNRAVAG